MTKTEAEKNSDKYHDLADRAYLKYQESGDARYYREQQRYEDIAEAFGLAAEAVEDVQKYRELKTELLYLAGQSRPRNRNTGYYEDGRHSRGRDRGRESVCRI